MHNKILQTPCASIPPSKRWNIFCFGFEYRRIGKTGEIHIFSRKQRRFKIPVDIRNRVNSKLNEHIEYIFTDCGTSGDLRIGQVREIIENANAVILNNENYR